MRAASAFPSRIFADIAGRIARARGPDARRRGRARNRGAPFARRRPCMDALPSSRRMPPLVRASPRRPWPPAALAARRAAGRRGVRAPQVETGHPLDRIAAGARPPVRAQRQRGAHVRRRRGERSDAARGSRAPPRTERRAGPRRPRRRGGAAGRRAPRRRQHARGRGRAGRRGARTEAPDARAARPTPGSSPHALAASAGGRRRLDRDVVGRLSRRRERMPRRPALDGRDLLLVAAAGGALVAATDDLLFCGARRRRRRRSDGGATFTVVAGLTERPRALALGADGATLVADDDGVLVIGADGATRANPRSPDRRAGGLRRRGARARRRRRLPLDARRHAARDRRPTAGPGDRAAVRSRGARWIATGLGVWTSPDGGDLDGADARRSGDRSPAPRRSATASGWRSTAARPRSTRRAEEPPAAPARRAARRPAARGAGLAPISDPPPRGPHPPLA